MRNPEQGTVLFSRYKIIDLIGSGGSSKVFLAENMRTGDLVAVKAVRKKDAGVNFIGEKDLLKELRHSSIPIIVDICEDEEGFYLIEEYVEGTSLGSLKLQLDEKEVQDIMMQLCDVLLYLHTSFEEPIIYRDMKPDNIIRMNNGRIKLIDFGIAIKASHLSDMSVAHYGTRGYAAPEQLNYCRSDEKTDIYALGVCMYYMLTGKNLSNPPYRLKPIREVNPDVTPEFAAIITKCIETLPAKRYPGVAQILHDIRNIGKVREGEADFASFRSHGRLLVTCAGMRRGIGTTQTAFLTAFYHARQHRRVALVEWQDRDDFLKIASLYEEVEEGRYSFDFHGVDCYFHTKGCNYDKAFRGKEAYDVIVIDAGTYEDLMVKGSFELTDELLVICGSKDWEIDYFEEAVFTTSFGRIKYMFNFTEDRVFLKISKDMTGIPIFQLPYNPNPYGPEKVMTALMAKVFSESLPVDDRAERGMLRHAKSLFEKSFRCAAEE